MILCGGLSKRGNETIEGNVDVCVAVRRRLARDIKQVDVSRAKQQKETSFERGGVASLAYPQIECLFDSHE